MSGYVNTGTEGGVGGYVWKGEVRCNSWLRDWCVLGLDSGGESVDSKSIIWYLSMAEADGSSSAIQFIIKNYPSFSLPVICRNISYRPSRCNQKISIF